MNSKQDLIQYIMEENNRRAEAKIDKIEELIIKFDNKEIESDYQLVELIRDVLSGD